MIKTYRILSYRGMSFKISSFEEVEIELIEMEKAGNIKPVVIQEFTKSVLTKETVCTYSGERWVH